MSKLFVLMSAVGVLVGMGCASVSDDAAKIPEARRLIVSGKAECVLIKDGVVFAQERGRGVSPLLEIYRTRKAAMKGGVVVDKVIGRAAAAVAICGQVRRVYGEVMSEDAAAFLRANGVKADCTLLVPRILNRKRDGLCPLEQAVAGYDDPHAALAALQKKIDSFSKKK